LLHALRLAPANEAFAALVVSVPEMLPNARHQAHRAVPLREALARACLCTIVPREPICAGMPGAPMSTKALRSVMPAAADIRRRRGPPS